MIVRKTASELEKMPAQRAAGAQDSARARRHGRGRHFDLGSGMAAVKMMADAGAKPAFKDYFVPAAGERYRYVLCTSVNEEIVHGMPNPKRVVRRATSCRSIRASSWKDISEIQR